MIVLLRVDDRLLHGQMAISWTKHLHVDTILIANQAAVNDEFTMMSLRLAKPRDVQIVIQDMTQALEFIKKELTSPQRIMVVVKSLKDAKHILTQFPAISNLNIGGLRSRNHVIRIQDSVALNENDLKICKSLINKINIFIQEIPNEQMKEINDLLKEGIS